TRVVALNLTLGSIAPRELGEARITRGTLAKLDREAGRRELVEASDPTDGIAEKDEARLVALVRDLHPIIKDHSSFHSIRRPIHRPLRLRLGPNFLREPSVTVEIRHRYLVILRVYGDPEAEVWTGHAHNRLRDG